MLTSMGLDGKEVVTGSDRSSTPTPSLSLEPHFYLVRLCHLVSAFLSFHYPYIHFATTSPCFSIAEGSKELDQFNRLYMAAFMETNSYKRWREHPEHTNILEAFPGHPFAGQLSVADMKLRLAQ